MNPVVTEYAFKPTQALQWVGNNEEDILNWLVSLGQKVDMSVDEDKTLTIYIHGFNVTLRVYLNSYVVAQFADFKWLAYEQSDIDFCYIKLDE